MLVVDETGRGDFAAVVVVVDEVVLFKTFSFNGDVERRDAVVGLSGDLAVPDNDEVVVLVPFVTFDFTVKDVGFAGAL